VKKLIKNMNSNKRKERSRISAPGNDHVPAPVIRPCPHDVPTPLEETQILGK
jgi:hypothetical protein